MPTPPALMTTPSLVVTETPGAGEMDTGPLAEMLVVTTLPGPEQPGEFTQYAMAGLPSVVTTSECCTMFVVAQSSGTAGHVTGGVSVAMGGSVIAMATLTGVAAGAGSALTDISTAAAGTSAGAGQTGAACSTYRATGSSSGGPATPARLATPASPGPSASESWLETDAANSQAKNTASVNNNPIVMILESFIIELYLFVYLYN
jgi:hypothetical protein